MANPTTADYYTYANLQMAAEAFIRDEQTGTLSDTGQDLITALERGNKHASAFPEPLARTFADDWKILDQRINTGTGFSGTLFQRLNSDPLTGGRAGDLVISFRSTEFIDDAARDNQATNDLDIRKFGWAFGQIDDMERWYAELLDNGTLKPTDRFTLTGYSLGAHLATAFNFLRKEEAEAGVRANPVAATYTFNGAGVGEVLNGARLTDVMADFRRMRENENGREIVFSDPRAAALYRELRNKAYRTSEEVALDIAEVVRRDVAAQESALLLSALGRIKTIVGEALRVPGLSSGGEQPSSPKRVDPGEIDAVRLDYQLAALISSKRTAGHNTGAIPGAIGAFSPREVRSGVFNNAFDVYGANPPSAVANSQWHYGQEVPLYIEDQPLYRGSAVWSAVKQSLLYQGVKLLVPEYQVNDFGDTHSLVLLVDSLAVMNVLARLDPQIRPERLASIFAAASTSAAETLGSSQGKAEGDTLETVVDALNLLLAGSDPKLREQPRLNEGGTWANLSTSSDLRTRFHQTLRDLQSSPVLEALAGKLVIGYPTPDQANLARTQFAAFLGLHTLAPFALRAVAGAEAEVEQALARNWASEYADWRADKDLTPTQRANGEGHTSDEYLADRAAFVAYLADAGSQNKNDHRIERYRGLRHNLRYADLASGKDLFVSARPPILGIDPREQQILFGGEDDDTLDGGSFTDHLYGADGADLISAGDGDDYLDGGADGDTLSGADGRDTLRGGDGDDTLIGGKGNDSLIGGRGEDTYRVAAGDGLDWIDDEDGLGWISYRSRRLGSGQLDYLTPNTWLEVTPSGTLTYALYDVTEGNESFQNLAILDDRGGVLIKRWQDGELALHRPEAPPTPSPAAGRTIVGDLEPIDFEPEPGVQPHADDLGNLITDPDSPEPGRADIFFDSPGNDLVQGRAGFDRMFGSRGGEDYTAASFEWLITEQANPFDRVFQPIHTDNVLPMPEGADVLYGSSGNDRLLGLTGDDLLYGERGNDTLAGYDHNDALFSGEGDDSMTGDYGAEVYASGAGAVAQGDDFLEGGEGALSAAGESEPIVDEDGLNTVRFAGSLSSLADITKTNQSDLLIRYGGDQVVIIDGMRGMVESFAFDDETLDLGQAFGRSLPQPTYYALPDGSSIGLGGYGNDTLTGSGASAVLSGGRGNDSLVANTARNVIQYGIGDGTDHISGPASERQERSREYARPVFRPRQNRSQASTGYPSAAPLRGVTGRQHENALCGGINPANAEKTAVQHRHLGRRAGRSFPHCTNLTVRVLDLI